MTSETDDHPTTEITKEFFSRITLFRYFSYARRGGNTYEIGLHTQFVGEILDVKVEDSVCDGKGHVDIEKVKPMLFDPEVNTYHGVGRLLGRAFSIGKDIRGR